MAKKTKETINKKAENKTEDACQSAEETQQAENQEASKKQESTADEDSKASQESGKDVDEAVKKAEEASEAVKQQLMRLQADFENYKKRTVREKSDIAQYTTEGIMTKLLPVIDNLERAEAAAEDETSSYRDGVQMVFKELMNVLKGEGLAEIEAVGKPFDPNFHHGVAVGNEDDKDDQEILEVFQKGYMLKDKVIRAAMVKINQK
ncbi:MAG: nucleotide exchange factor GrpE [Eubacteriaceae bacterium]|jgi:molecular chaperone GrpE|nr:nucleotide exchange factor GrpE [Eubacteriaceae bacterium]